MMKCRLCDSIDLKLFYTQGNQHQFKFYRCRECNLVNYQLEGGLDQKKYTEKYADPLNEDLKQNQDQKKAYQFVSRHLQGTGRYLDIGCGNGKLLLLAQSDGWAVTGMELSNLYAEEIGKRFGIPVKVANFLEYQPHNNEAYRLVSLRHVLEHLPDPIFAMKKINGLLEEGGYAFMEFPYIDGLESRFKRFGARTGLFRRKYPDDYFPGHCHEYSEKPFRLLCEKTGFALKYWQTYSSKSWLNPFYQFVGLGSKVRVILQKRSIPV